MSSKFGLLDIWSFSATCLGLHKAKHIARVCIKLREAKCELKSMSDFLSI